MRTVDDYKSLLINLLPMGFIWPIVTQLKKLVELLAVFASELLSVDDRNDDLLNELMPDTTNELLERWENILGLPEPCITATQTFQQRVNAVVAKIGLNASLSKQFYIDMALQLGYTITITVLAAASWQVNGSLATITYFRADISACGEPLQVSDNDLLECAIQQAKPAHTQVTFSYT